MASLETLDLAVRIGGNFDTLDDIADKLDVIHRKAQKVRHNDINFDVDGDGETIARAEAVDRKLDEAAEDRHAHISTSGGYDIDDVLGGILSKTGELQGAAKDFAERMELDESRLNEPLDKARSIIKDRDLDDLTTKELREVEPHFAEAKAQFAELGVESYFDTSEFQQTIAEAQNELYEALGETHQEQLTAEYERSVDFDVGSDIDFEDDIREIQHQFDDADDFDRDVFSERVHSLGASVAESESFLRRMGIDPEAVYDELGLIHSQLSEDIDTGDIDSDSLREYNVELKKVSGRLNKANTLAKQFQALTSDFGELRTAIDADFSDSDFDEDAFRTRLRDFDDKIQQFQIQRQLVLNEVLDSDSDLVDSDSSEGEIDFDAEPAMRKATAMRVALAALDDTVAHPETHLDIDTDSDAGADTDFDERVSIADLDIDQRTAFSEHVNDYLDAFSREQSLLGANLFGTDESGFQTELSEIGLIENDITQTDLEYALSDLVGLDFTEFSTGEERIGDSQRGVPTRQDIVDITDRVEWSMFDTESESEPLSLPREISDEGEERSFLRKARDYVADMFVGPENAIRAKGEVFFDKEDFIAEGFKAEDLFDADADVSIDDIFEYDGRELTDIFESEKAFRDYLAPPNREFDVDSGELVESDEQIGLRDVLRDDRNLVDLSKGSRGPRRMFENFSKKLNISVFYDAFAKTIPLLVTFIGAMPAAIAGLITIGGAALAAAGTLAAVGGLSLAGLAYTLGGGDLQKGLEEIKSRLIERAESEFRPLAGRFDDLGFDALRGLEKFITAIAAESVALTQLKDEARDVGEWIFDNIPDAIDDVVALVEAFSPLFGMFAGWLTNTDFLGAFVSGTRKALPEILAIIDAFLMMLPTIMKFSQGMLYVTGIVFKFWAMVWSVIDAFGPLAKYLGIAIGLLLSLYTTLTLVNVAMGMFSTVVGSTAVKSLWSYIMGSNLATVATTRLAAAISWVAATALGRFIVSLITAIPLIGTYIAGTTAMTVATYVLAAAIAATGIGLLFVLVGALGGAMLSTSSDIDKATKSLEDFKDARDGLESGIDNPYEPLKLGAMTDVRPRKRRLRGSGPNARMPSSQSRSRSSNEPQNKTVVNNNQQTTIDVTTDGTRKDGIRASRDLDHQLFTKNEVSSSPY